MAIWSDEPVEDLIGAVVRFQYDLTIASSNV
jgi:hypothetical protein